MTTCIAYLCPSIITCLTVQMSLFDPTSIRIYAQMLCFTTLRRHANTPSGRVKTTSFIVYFASLKNHLFNRIIEHPGPPSTEPPSCAFHLVYGIMAPSGPPPRGWRENDDVYSVCWLPRRITCFTVEFASAAAVIESIDIPLILATFAQDHYFYSIISSELTGATIHAISRVSTTFAKWLYLSWYIDMLIDSPKVTWFTV